MIAQAQAALCDILGEKEKRFLESSSVSHV